jgi:hypothetical protein
VTAPEVIAEALTRLSGVDRGAVEDQPDGLRAPRERAPEQLLSLALNAGHHACEHLVHIVEHQLRRDLEHFDERWSGHRLGRIPQPVAPHDAVRAAVAVEEDLHVDAAPHDRASDVQRLGRHVRGERPSITPSHRGQEATQVRTLARGQLRLEQRVAGENRRGLGDRGVHLGTDTVQVGEHQLGSRAQLIDDRRRDRPRTHADAVCHRT